MLYLGWIIAAFLAGGIISALYFTRRRSLRDRLAALGPLVGRDYRQIESVLSAFPRSTIREKNGQTMSTWQEGSYTVSLLFDSNGICLGVMDEKG